MITKECVFIESPQTNLIVMHWLLVADKYPTFIEFNGYLAKLSDVTAKGTARYLIDLY